MLWLAPVAANSLLLPAGSLGFGDHRILGLRERGSVKFFDVVFHLTNKVPAWISSAKQTWDSFTAERMLFILNPGSQMPPDPIRIVYVGVRVAERR